MSDSRARGIHFETLKKAIPPVLLKASAKRRAELRETRPVLPGWFTRASSDQQQALQHATETLHRRQNARDALFDKIQSIETFAKICWNLSCTNSTRVSMPTTPGCACTRRKASVFSGSRAKR